MADAGGYIRLGLLGAAVALRSASALAASPTVEVPGPEPKVTLVLEDPAGSRLMRENVHGWGSVCQAPCAARVPRDGNFVVEVPGSKRTGRLDLEQSPEVVRLRLTPPSEDGLIAGTLLTYFGASIAPIGLLVMLGGLAFHDERATTAGGVVAALGGVAVGVGIPLIVINRHTAVEQQPVAQGLRLLGRF